MEKPDKPSKKSSLAWWIGFIALALLLNFGENILTACILGTVLLHVVAPLLAKQPSWDIAIFSVIGILLLSALLLIPIGALNVICASKLSKRNRKRAAKVLGTVGAVVWAGWACVTGVSLLQPDRIGAEPTLGTIAIIWLPICFVLNAAGQVWAVRSICKERDIPRSTDHG